MSAIASDISTSLISSPGSPVVRPMGKGVYLYDADGFMVEVRCNPA